MPLNKQNLFKNAEVSKKAFLKNYWHKKPLVLFDAIDMAELSVFPNKHQLMQMSTNKDIQSRVVIKESESRYDVEIGPFVDVDLKNLEGYCWNLLISDIDKWQPQSRQILSYFDFIRNWIFDDIMLSTGSIGGTVGPHTDHYDVFLLQVHGQRQWRYSTEKIYNPKLIPDQDLKLMKDFNHTNSIILNPGDILYLPPEVAHYGIATSDDCVTCSIGIRTPSHAELLTSFVDNIAENISENNRLTEPQFKTQPKTGEFTQKDINKLSKILNRHLDTNNLCHWFGQFITDYRSIFHQFNKNQNSHELDESVNLIPNPFGKSCYFKEENKAFLFINGEKFDTSQALAELICDEKFIHYKQRNKLTISDRSIIDKLFENGALINAKT